MAGRSPFAAAARSPLEQPLRSSGRWLEDGTYDVVIEDSDSAQAGATGKLHVVFRAREGGAHREQLFILNREGTGFSYIFAQLVGSVLHSAEAQQKFRDLLARDDTYQRVLECFRGMRVRITLESNDGFRIVPNRDDGSYSAVQRDGTVIADRVKSATEAERRARALGLKKIFRSVTRIEAIDHDTTQVNLQAFDNAATSIEKSTPTQDSPETNFAGYAGAPPTE
jgi:hypothetical protein